MRISKLKQEKISEQILSVLFSSNLKPLFVSEIAQELARDEEFIKKLLYSLKNKKIVSKISKNPKGIEYLKRSRWKLTEGAYKMYKQAQ